MSTVCNEYLTEHLQEVIDFVEDMKQTMSRRDAETVDTGAVVDVLITLDSELALYNEEVTGG